MRRIEIVLNCSLNAISHFSRQSKVLFSNSIKKAIWRIFIEEYPLVFSGQKILLIGAIISVPAFKMTALL